MLVRQTVTWQQHKTLFLSVSLSVLLALTVFFSLQAWLLDWHLTHQPQASEPTTTTMDANQALLDTLPASILFGKNLHAAGDLPFTDLQIKITGIVNDVSALHAERSKVYLAQDGDASKIYHEGDRLPLGVRVYRINDDHVIFENEGRLEKLRLHRQTLAFKPRIKHED